MQTNNMNKASWLERKTGEQIKYQPYNVKNIYYLNGWHQQKLNHVHVHFFPSQSSALFNPITKKITTLSQYLPSHFSIKEKRKWNENPKVVLVHSPPCKGRALVLSVKLKAFILPPTHTFHHHQIIGREIKEKLNMS